MKELNEMLRGTQLSNLLEQKEKLSKDLSELMQRFKDEKAQNKRKLKELNKAKLDAQQRTNELNEKTQMYRTKVTSMKVKIVDAEEEIERLQKSLEHQSQTLDLFKLQTAEETQQLQHEYVT